MSRHRKVRALDYDEEYDDYYGAFDDDDDEDLGLDGEDNFEAKYLGSGIDLNVNKSNNISSTQIEQLPPNTFQVQTILDSSVQCNETASHDANHKIFSPTSPGGQLSSNKNLVNKTNFCESKLSSIKQVSTNFPPSISNLTSDLKRIAIQHLNKHQWQLPLMEMDQNFRDKTYYSHYKNNGYTSPLGSKLGHFLAENRLTGMQSRQFPSRSIRKNCETILLALDKQFNSVERSDSIDENLGATADQIHEEEDDGVQTTKTRLETKGKQGPQPSGQVPQVATKTPRFEYHGQKSGNTTGAKAQSKGDKSLSAKKAQPSKKPPQPEAKPKLSSKVLPNEITVSEDLTAEKLDALSKQYKELLEIENKKTKKTNELPSSSSSPSLTSAKKLSKTKITSNVATSVQKQQQQQPSGAKQLVTLTEKRQSLKNQLKRIAEPSARDLEAFKLRAVQATKEYDELVKSSRPRINLVVVGHVDAGKSTLVGHLLFKLGAISDKQMHRYEVDSQRSGKASFKFAWALDETSEERSRGVTIDIALTQFETPHKDVVLLDAPGHVDFIPAVISGAAQADAALLIVDATRGEFETGFSAGGQTREHTFLVRSLGVRSLVVVVNKMDCVNWDWNRFSFIVEQLIPFLKQVGFDLKEDVQFIAASGLTGDNLLERRLDKLMKQSSHPQMESACSVNINSMPSLIEAIDKMRQPERLVDKPTRVVVTDIYKGMSSGVFLGGRVLGGKLENKQKVLLLPVNEFCEVKQVEVRDSKATRAFAGDIVTTVATGIDMNKFYRGCVLCDCLLPCQVTNRFQARIIMFQNAGTILIKGTPIEVHINGTYESGEVRKLISLLNKNTGELVQRRPRCLAKNSSAIVQLKLNRVVCCELYEENKDLGRFMMRSCGKTIAAGLITLIKTPKVPKRGSKLKSKS